MDGIDNFPPRSPVPCCQDGCTTLGTRRNFAAAAYALSAAYDSAISSWFCGELGGAAPVTSRVYHREMTLKYGCNPQQKVKGGREECVCVCVRTMIFCVQRCVCFRSRAVRSGRCGAVHSGYIGFWRFFFLRESQLDDRFAPHACRAFQRANTRVETGNWFCVLPTHGS